MENLPQVSSGKSRDQAGKAPLEASGKFTGPFASPLRALAGRAVGVSGARKKRRPPEHRTLVAALQSKLNEISLPQGGEQNYYGQVLQIYGSLLDFMPVGLIGVDSSGVIVKMNHFVVSHLKLDAALVGSQLESLPFPLSSLAANLENPETLPGTISLILNGHEVMALIKHFNCNGMEGLMLIIVLVPADRDGFESPPAM